MFTGIIQTKGKITKIISTDKETELSIEADDIFYNKKIGSSIAVDGVCLTITKTEENKAYFNLMTTTLDATKLKDAKEGMEVNLEPPLSFGQGLDGHLVQGHIDGTGEILEVRTEDKQTILKLSCPEEFRKYLAPKGSITINGVSLTISSIDQSTFEVSLVKHTLKTTTLTDLNKGDKVNLEFDAIAKYISSLMKATNGN
jgi:riboflavin synthase